MNKIPKYTMHNEVRTILHYCYKNEFNFMDEISKYTMQSYMVCTVKYTKQIIMTYIAELLWHAKKIDSSPNFHVELLFILFPTTMTLHFFELNFRFHFLANWCEIRKSVWSSLGDSAIKTTSSANRRQLVRFNDIFTPIFVSLNIWTRSFINTEKRVEDKTQLCLTPYSWLK